MLFTANIFQPLIDVFESVLKFFHNSGGISWGWSIVLLTVCVRAVLVPLTIRQMGSMTRMQRLQPELKALQSKYKDDKERQQQEMMKFYKENNVNPLASCLPMVAQLPVFISLYYMLRQSLRYDICPAVQRAYQAHYAAIHHLPLHAAAGQTTACRGVGGSSFLFINDLTAQATGATLVALIILYVGSQLASSLLMSSPTMDKRQRQLMLFMPLIFVLFVIRFPAGVLVYWITTNIWTIGQQYIIKRRIGPTQAAPAAATTGAAGAVATTTATDTPREGRSKPDRTPRATGARSGGDGNGSGKTSSGKATSSGPPPGGGGGLAGLIRKAGGAKSADEPKQPVATATRGGPPPKSPRKKKKRSGRRR